jgi:hypothetical protein
VLGRHHARTIRCHLTGAGSVVVRVLAGALPTEIDMSFRTRSPRHGLPDIGHGNRLLAEATTQLDRSRILTLDSESRRASPRARRRASARAAHARTCIRTPTPPPPPWMADTARWTSSEPSPSSGAGGRPLFSGRKAPNSILGGRGSPLRPGKVAVGRRSGNRLWSISLTRACDTPRGYAATMSSLAAYPGMMRRDRQRLGLRECRAAWLVGVTVRGYREMEAERMVEVFEWPQSFVGGATTSGRP